jgi:hypothetical protein
MVKEFWHNLITEKSFYLLQELKRGFDFVLIGGWAIYFYTHSLKSKDIDIIVDLETLGQLKQKFEVYKNERLKKYEIKIEGIDIDIYIPYWSDLGLAIDKVIASAISVESFKIPSKEILLTLKLFVYAQRKASLKGRKDLIDIISLLHFGNLDFASFNNILESNDLLYLRKELQEIFLSNTEIEELDINQKKFSDLKKKILPLL